MKTLKEQVEGTGVVYVLERARVLLIRKGRDISKPQGDGTYIKEYMPDIYASRVGSGTNLTARLDPENEGHVEVIQIYDDYIKKNAGRARQQGFYKNGSQRPENFIQRWDDMTLDQISAVLDAMRPDLLTGMRMELLRPEDIGGPREDVMELLEQLNADGYEVDVEVSDEVPVLG